MVQQVVVVVVVPPPLLLLLLLCPSWRWSELIALLSNLLGARPALRQQQQVAPEKGSSSRASKPSSERAEGNSAQLELGATAALIAAVYPSRPPAADG